MKEQKEKQSPGSEAAAALRSHQMGGCGPQRRGAAHSGHPSIVVQWLRLHTPNGGGLGTRSHMLQLGVHMPQIKSLPSATETWCSRMNKYEMFFF